MNKEKQIARLRQFFLSKEWKYVEKFLETKYNIYLKSLAQQSFYNVYSQKPEIFLTEGNIYFTRGRLLGWNFIFKSLRLTQRLFLRFTKKRNYKYVILMKGFLDALKQFLFWTKFISLKKERRR